MISLKCDLSTMKVQSQRCLNKSNQLFERYVLSSGVTNSLLIFEDRCIVEAPCRCRNNPKKLEDVDTSVGPAQVDTVS